MTDVTDSILTSVKKILGLAEGYTAFDQDVILFTNSVLSTLNQLGVGPAEGFAIDDDSATWSDLLGSDKRFNSVKTFVCLNVRVLFDPPQLGSTMQAYKEQIDQYAWRINVQREENQWAIANPGSEPIPYISGGDADDLPDWSTV